MIQPLRYREEKKFKYIADSTEPLEWKTVYVTVYAGDYPFATLIPQYIKSETVPDYWKISLNINLLTFPNQGMSLDHCKRIVEKVWNEFVDKINKPSTKKIVRRK